MTAHSTLDPESFQELLANAFAVQESQMDTQSLAAVFEVQRLITSGDLDVNGAMHLIADRARNVANATGAAIGLLKGDQLVYQAGSGSAASYTGRQVTATLIASAGTGTGHEILRVENAETDKRMEATICRQFGDKSLLILLISHDRAPAGVLEVHFSEAHGFHDREVRTYRLMAGLVAETISRADEQARTKAMAAEILTVPPAIEHIAFQMKKVPSDGRSIPEPPNKHATYQACGAGIAVAGELLPGQPAGAATMITQRVKRVPLLNRRWNLAVAAVVAVFVIACWIAYSNRHSASPSRTSVQQPSNAFEQQVPLVPAKPLPAKSTSKLQTAPVATKEARARRATFQRVRVGKNEVDYLAEDVTIRYFKPKSAPQRVRVGRHQVNIGEDVTVRYFAPKPAVVPPTRPSPRPAQPVERSLPVPEKAASPEPAR
jgi:hypothetical protein